MDEQKKKIGRWSAFGAGLAAILYGLLYRGGPAPRPPIATCAEEARTPEYEATCTALYRRELGRDPDESGKAECLRRARACETADQIAAWIHDSDEAVAYRDRLAHHPMPPPSAVPNAGETGTGRVHVVGKTFRYVATGAVFPWVGVDGFRLLEHSLAGKDIDAWLTDVLTKPDGTFYAPGTGPNVIRVFGMYNCARRADGRCQDRTGIGWLKPQEHPRYYDALGSLADLLERRGFRFEFVVFADAQILMPDPREQERHIARVADVLATRTNTFAETVNEAFKNIPGGAARAYELGLRVRGRGFPIATGDYTVTNDRLYRLDYATFHTDRKAEWPRTAKDVLELRDGFGNFPGTGTPVVADEPTGAAEQARGDSRSATPEDFAWYCATAHLEGAGQTFHSDAGLTTTTFGPVQRKAAAACWWAARWVPVEAQIWPYMRGGSGGCDGVGEMPYEHSDALELRSFAKAQGSQAWGIQIRTTRSHPTPCRGYRVVAEPRRGFVELAR